MVGPTEWFLLNEAGNLEELGWQNNSRSKLWRYNQHYFDDLNALNAFERLSWHNRLIERWINENPPGAGNGWEPYPTSRRIVNWVKWGSAFGELSSSAIASLAIQTRWLVRRLEWHLLGNHLLVNAKALVFSGLYFEGAEANHWLRLGMQILKEQVPEQILEDGGHFELTPLYHALAVEDLLDLINICEANFNRLTSNHTLQIASWRKLLPRMLHWLSCMSHPDGKISFFNDSAFNIAPDNKELFQYANNLGFQTFNIKNGITDLTASGIVRLQTTLAVLIADIASIGPDYLPGHAHADTLSFEFSLVGHRIFVNSGTSVYGQGAERLKQRGTAAHNTVCVKNQDSSEVWSGFRVGSRAVIKERIVGTRESLLFAYGTHDGYARQNKGLLHSRKFYLAENFLQIKDTLSFQENAEARYFLHPSVKVTQHDATSGDLYLKNGQALKWRFSGVSQVSIVESHWYPEFGVSIPNKCLLAGFNGRQCSLKVEWT